MPNPLTDFSNHLTAAVQRGGASTVLVDARKRHPASGIAYTEDLVLTADHVVTRDENINVVTPDGKTLPATIAGRDPGSDLALLRLAEKALSPAKTSEDVKVGQLVLALGRPGRAGVEHRRTCGFDDLRFSRDERLHGARASLDKHDLHVESVPLKKTRVLGNPQRGGAADRHGLIGSRHLIGATRGRSGSGEKNQRGNNESETSVCGAPFRRLKTES